MTGKERILRWLGGTAPGVPTQGPPSGELPDFVPDLTAWHAWHSARHTLPAEWAGLSLAEVCRALGVPAWVTVRPWEVRLRESLVTVETREDGDERLVTYRTHHGTLSARWTRGPDGDWWQAEYPLEAAEHLPAVLALAEARAHALRPEVYAEAAAAVGDDGVAVVELPQRPFSEVLHTFTGWDDGLALLDEPGIRDVLDLLESRLADLLRAVAELGAPVALSPDNLDGQFISPDAFDDYLAGSYERAATALRLHGTHLVVHVGGPCRRLLAALSTTGISGVMGISEPPQGDLSLARARSLAGPDLALWGGIPQDLLLPAYDRESFESAVLNVARDAAGDPLTLLGVADRVPVQADLARLAAIPELVRQAAT